MNLSRNRKRRARPLRLRRRNLRRQRNLRHRRRPKSQQNSNHVSEKQGGLHQVALLPISFPSSKRIWYNIRMKTILFVVASYLLAALFFSSGFAQEKPSPSGNLALTPPMGWNSWNKFACNVSEDLIKGMADAVVKSGMKDAGYVYVNIDDCWQVSRDASGNIVWDPALSARHESGWRLHPFARSEIRSLF